MTLNDNQFKELTGKIDVIIKLLGINLIGNYKKNNEKIEFLSSLGLDSKVIIFITKIPPKTVYNVLSELRKKEDTKIE